MAKRVKAEVTEELVQQSLHRMIVRRFSQLRRETGATDFSGEESEFHFSASEVNTLIDVDHGKLEGLMRRMANESKVSGLSSTRIVKGKAVSRYVRFAPLELAETLVELSLKHS